MDSDAEEFVRHILDVMSADEVKAKSRAGAAQALENLGGDRSLVSNPAHARAFLESVDLDAIIARENEGRYASEDDRFIRRQQLEIVRDVGLALLKHV